MENEIVIMNTNQAQKDLPAYFYCPLVRRGQDIINQLIPLIEGKGWIAGSFAAWACSHEVFWEPNDIDIFCLNAETRKEIQTALRRLNYRVQQYGDTVNRLAPLGDNHPIGYDVQLIVSHPNWKTFPLDILKSFDLNICRAVLLDTENSIADVDLGSTEARVLLINSPLRVLQRMMKYHKRGVEFGNYELIKLFRAWDKMTEDQKVACEDAMIPAPEPDDYDSAFDDYFFSE